MSDEEEAAALAPDPTRDLPSSIKFGVLTFSSEFDGGNGRFEKKGSTVLIHTRRDAEGTPGENGNKSWFFFSVSGGAVGKNVNLKVCGMNKLKKLYNRGMKPVYKDSTMTTFARIPGTSTFTGEGKDSGSSLKWQHQFKSSGPVFFAFCFPYTVTDMEEHLAALDALSFPFVYQRETLCHSLGGRPVHLLTITANEEGACSSADLLGEDHPALSSSCGKRKPVVFVSSRVHPGEVPAQFVFDGMLDFVLSEDPRAVRFRELYVLKMIPMLNPDGVAMGHYRSDSLGENLNRWYHDPCTNRHPTISMVKDLLRSIQEKGELYAYIDLHAHANKRGCFIYGNAAADDVQQGEILLLPKLIALNTPWFDYGSCNFTEKNMRTKDKRDGLSKEMGILRSYVIECNYNDGGVVNEVLPASGGDPRASPPRAAPRSRVPKYGPAEWRHVGKAVAVGLLDLQEVH